MSKRSYSLDLLKTLATVAIVFHHYQLITGAQFRYNFSGGWFYWGYCVELFFLLSGYFMFKYIPTIYEGKTRFKAWFGRRWLRIVPVMAASIVVFEAAIYCHIRLFGEFWQGLGVSIWGSIVAMLGLQEGGVFLNPCVNNPTWYIGVMFVCYALFYLVTRLAARLRTSPYGFYIALVFLGVGITSYGINLPFLQEQTARGYRCFFFGILLASQTHRDRAEVTRLGRVALAIIAAFVALLILNRDLLNEGIQYTLSFVVFPAIIVTMDSKPMRQLFSHSLWGLLGAVSFNVYMWHVPLIVICQTVIRRRGIALDYNNWKYMLAFLLLAEAVGFLSHYLIEKPASRRSGRLIEKLESEGG